MPHSKYAAATTVIRLAAHGRLEESTDELFILMVQATTDGEQYNVARALAEVTASVAREARCCPGVLIAVDPRLVEAALQNGEAGRAVLWAARFFAAIANDDLPNAEALWTARPDGMSGIAALIMRTAPALNDPTFPLQ